MLCSLIRLKLVLSVLCVVWMNLLWIWWMFFRVIFCGVLVGVMDLLFWLLVMNIWVLVWIGEGVIGVLLLVCSE